MKNVNAVSNNLSFNPSSPFTMHIDLNSCFASIEQQANPLLRGTPIAVAAYTTPSGCILAASIEAKKLGVKTGMRVADGKKLCPYLRVLPADPNKYRYVHKGLKKIMGDYTSEFYPKSIDEFVLNMKGFPAAREKGMILTAKEIKKRIKKEVGEWLTVSVGIATNRSLAKLASNLQKPDGLQEINKDNFLRVFMGISLRDFSGINFRNEKRLRSVGIYHPIDFYMAPPWKLKAAFRSVLSTYWYIRIRGWEIDDIEFKRRTFGNSYALPSSNGTLEELLPILSKLTEKTGFRLRRAGYEARGVHVGLYFRNGRFWHKGKLLGKNIYDSRDVYKEALVLLKKCEEMSPVRVLSECVFSLEKSENSQLELFVDRLKMKRLTDSVDEINEIWGEFIVTPARFLELKSDITDRISFGGVRDV